MKNKYQLIIEKKYIIDLNNDNKLGKGSYGVTYKGINSNNKNIVAIKIEEKETSLLINEAKIYNLLNNIKGVSKLRSYGSEGNFNYMVIDYLGCTIEHIKLLNSKIKKKLIREYGIQMINIIEKIHNKGIIHRDIKPDNFLLYNNNIYLIDYGLSKYIIYDEKEKEKENNRFIGNLRYSSINVLNNISPSRRDDIISIMYILLYLLCGKLPWQNNNNKFNIKEVLDIKMTHNFNDNCEYIQTILNYLKNVKYSEKPNYSYIINMLKKI